MTAERKAGISLLHEDLTKQTSDLEEKITVLAQEFNTAAEQLQPSQTAQIPEKPVAETPPPAAEEDKAPRRQQRRGSRFGNELTLDD